MRIRAIEILATIRATIVPFFSILMFVALGVAVFLGLQWSADALAASFDTAFDDTSFHDIEIQVPYGLEAQDLKQIESVDGVELVETGYVSTQALRREDTTAAIKVQSLCETLDRPLVREGTLPARPDEIALMARWAQSVGLGVGDTVSFEPDGADGTGMRHLRASTYRVSALVEAPGYAAKDSATYSMSATSNGSVACVAFVTTDAFDPASFQGGLPCAYLRCSGTTGLSTFSRAYQERVDLVADRLNDDVGTLITERMTTLYELYAGIRDVLRDVVSGYQSKMQELDKETTHISERERRGEISRDEANRLKAEASSSLDVILSPLNPIDDESYEALGIARPDGTIDHTNAGPVLDQLSDLIEGADDIEIEVSGQVIALGSLPDKIAQVRDIFAKRGRQAFVLDRSHNGGVILAQMLISILGRLRLSMAALFVLVGLLVCYSALSRLVHDQVTLIGTKKALGFRVREVSATYLVYAASAVILGIVVGTVAAVLVVQRIINPRLANVFVLGAYPPAFSLRDTLFAGGVELALILVTTWLTCRRICGKDPRELLAGPEPPDAKRRFFENWALWQRLPLFSQVIINNCLNERRRAIATLIGVAGCTSLVVCALTLNNNVIGSFERHYRDVYGFDAIVSLDGKEAGAEARVGAALTERSLAWAPVLRRTTILSKGNGDASIATLYVPTDEERFSALYHLLPTGASRGGSADLSDTGAWVSQGFAEAHGLVSGDSVEISDSSGQTYAVPVLGSFEYHLISTDVVMGARAYEEVFGAKAEANALVVDTGAGPLDELERELGGVAGFGTLRNDKALAQRGFNQFSRLSQAVVLVYLALSALMAIVVLLNLDVMFIEEKRRELIVLMICGYSTGKAKAYVRNDTIVLTALGILVGIVLGAIAGYATVRSVEPPGVVFLHDIDGIACLIAAATSTVLATIVGHIALRRIPRMDLTGINRF